MKTATPQAHSGKATPITFHTRILQTGKNTAGIQVPEDVMVRLAAGKRPLVLVNIKKHAYRSAVAVMGGKYMIALSAENRQAAGVLGGEDVDVTIQLDLEPRTVQLPKDLRAALAKAGALEAFANAAPSKQKEYVRQVQEAKAEETRLRRITKIVAALRGKQR
jgi:hypothetical protein